MSEEFGGLWKHENNQDALVPQKTECGCPSGGGIKNGHICYPSYGGTHKKIKKRRKKKKKKISFQFSLLTRLSHPRCSLRGWWSRTACGFWAFWTACCYWGASSSFSSTSWPTGSAAKVAVSLSRCGPSWRRTSTMWRALKRRSTLPLCWEAVLWLVSGEGRMSVRSYSVQWLKLPVRFW